jgi:hypothetical protein
VSEANDTSKGQTAKTPEANRVEPVEQVEAKPAAPERKNQKEFSLKSVESQLLAIAIQQHQALISNLVSYYAIERLAYPVDANTKFELSNDLKQVRIYQEEAPEAPQAPEVEVA